ncbi:uncharacterized protein LOC141691671 [Apium graveolens]|uniref:uncharacterized protein LOC141691671 n=1 Tax=Apium graveolens TaxID=4045 RepID=UPI003D7A7B47
MARVFRLKLDQLIDDIMKNNFFGTCLGAKVLDQLFAPISSVISVALERGLPHVHMLIWLDSASKHDLQANVNKYVSAEIPDPNVDPVGYAAYLYDEIPQHYVWNDADRTWLPRKKGKKIGRLDYTHHTSGEIWYFHFLLIKVHGATSFESLGTVKGKICSTYQGAFGDFGLLDDDNEWHQREIRGNPHLILNEKQQQFYALAEIHNILKTIGKFLEDYSQMPQPPHSYFDCGLNNLIVEKTSYNISEMEKKILDLYSSCNAEQLEVYNAVMQSASSGIAATLMPRGQTAHSRFKILIVLDEHSMCSISHTSNIAELIKQKKLIIWNEAPIQHNYSFECVDRSLRDIMKAVDPERFHIPFRGFIVVLDSNFRQIFPVITRASCGEIVSSCIT